MTKEPMEKMPKIARSIARIIRRGVKRPSVKIFFWRRINDVFRTRAGKCCPMGMHPRAEHRQPISTDGFPPSKNDSAIIEFGNWWDCIEKHQLKDAIDAVWGKKK